MTAVAQSSCGSNKPGPLPIAIVGLEPEVERRYRAAQISQIRDFENLPEIRGAVLRPGEEKVAERMLG